MKIIIVSPAWEDATSGNSITADRWTGILQKLGHEVDVVAEWRRQPSDVLIALHARRSHPSVESYHRARPEGPLIVALTGTDLYNDLPTSREAQDSLLAATHIVVLQSAALDLLAADVRTKARVIYQSAIPPGEPSCRANDRFDVCLLSHLREVKDPLRVAQASRLLPEASKLRIVHAGRALDSNLEKLARQEESENFRYRWVGEQTHEAAIRLLNKSHLFALPSIMEGGANAIAEAVVCNVPVVCSEISGNIGMLGRDYPGYFRAGDTEQLAHLLYRAESDSSFAGAFLDHIRNLQYRFSPEEEFARWRELLSSIRSA